MTSQTPDMQTVLERLDRLERQNRRLKRTGAVTLALIAAVLLMGQAAPKKHRTVEAERFVLRDAEGKVRATLGVTEWPRGRISQQLKLPTNVTPALAFYDDQGHQTGRLDQSLLQFFDNHGDELLTLDPNHIAFFESNQPAGSRARILLELLDGKPMISLTKDSKYIWTAP